MKKRDLSPFAKKLKRARKEMGLSQKDLADMLQVSDKAISSYEVDRALPPLDTLQRISAITHKSVEYFVSQDEEENQELELASRLKKIEYDLLEAKKLLADIEMKRILQKNSK